MLIILDKDGTLIEPASGQTFVQHPQDQKLLPGVADRVADRVAELKAAGATLVIASNQGGCSAVNRKTGRPYKTMEDTIAEMQFCMFLLPEIDHAFFCPDFFGHYLWSVPKDSQIYAKDTLTGEIYPQINEDGSPMMAEAKEVSDDHRFFYRGCKGTFRKPHPGMLLSAQVWAGLVPATMIGDSPDDRGAAEAANIPFVDAQEWRSGQVTISFGSSVTSSDA